jgi:hypothetical protein
MESETFWTLLQNSAHWEFELFLMIIFDVLIGTILWPRLKKWKSHHKSDDDKLADLDRRLTMLELHKSNPIQNKTSSD